MKKHIWLRAETKDFERRTPLVPADAKLLVEQGVKVSVEKCPNRIFKNEDYEKVGCELVEFGSFKDANQDVLILGLKELPEDLEEIPHQHIYFAHVFKGQDWAEDILGKFNKGKGQLFDLEYLVDGNGRRIAAFGKWAGIIGTALAIDYFYHGQISKDAYPGLTHFEDHDDMIDSIKSKQAQSSVHPDVIVVGASGRCGGGAMETIANLGLKATPWDTSHTKRGGPFKEILDHHIFVNSVLITKKIPPFLTKEILSDGQQLKVIADVSCDPSSELNPIPLYEKETTWAQPFYDAKHVDILAVDNLPSILPKESSMDFSSQLTPHLIELMDKGVQEDNVWGRSLATFKEFSK